MASGRAFSPSRPHRRIFPRPRFTTMSLARYRQIPSGCRGRCSSAPCMTCIPALPIWTRATTSPPGPCCLWRLFPWTAAGVVLGYFTLGRISDHTARILIGWIIVSLAALSFWRRYFAAPNGEKAASFHWSVGAVIGMTAGFITLVANAAGPLMAIYLVAMRLPKMEYVGTAAGLFMLLNLFTVPFIVDLGLLTTQSFSFNLMLAPAVLLGALAGRWLLQHVNQKLFEQLVLLLSALGGILLIL